MQLMLWIMIKYCQPRFISEKHQLALSENIQKRQSSYPNDGALPLRKLRRLYKPQCRERLGLCCALHYPDDSEWMMRIFYHCWAHLVFSDTMIANTFSRRSNRCALLHVTDLGWATAFPIASRNEAHEIVPLLIDKDCVQSACICNNAKRWSKAHSMKSTNMLHVIWNSWSLTLPGPMLQKKR